MGLGLTTSGAHDAPVVSAVHGASSVGLLNHEALEAHQRNSVQVLPEFDGRLSPQLQDNRPEVLSGVLQSKDSVVGDSGRYTFCLVTGSEGIPKNWSLGFVAYTDEPAEMMPASTSPSQTTKCSRCATAPLFGM